MKETDEESDDVHNVETQNFLRSQSKLFNQAEQELKRLNHLLQIQKDSLLEKDPQNEWQFHLKPFLT